MNPKNLKYHKEHDWARIEGWNPGLDDAPPFWAADPLGYFLAEVDGQPAAAISVVNHDDSFAFLGLYLCRPAFRGRGIAKRLMIDAMSHLRREGMEEAELGVGRCEERSWSWDVMWSPAQLRTRPVPIPPCTPRWPRSGRPPGPSGDVGCAVACCS